MQWPVATLLPVYRTSNTLQLATVENEVYSEYMARVIRSAMLSMRVRPEIRLASENVLERLGLNMTEAMEMFLCRMVVDQRIPFEVVAIDPAKFTELVLDWQEESRSVEKKRGRRLSKECRIRVQSKRE
jgi:addiction module RelB/DinJ family antitoxin